MHPERLNSQGCADHGLVALVPDGQCVCLHGAFNESGAEDDTGGQGAARKMKTGPTAWHIGVAYCGAVLFGILPLLVQSRWQDAISSVVTFPLGLAAGIAFFATILLLGVLPPVNPFPFVIGVLYVSYAFVGVKAVRQHSRRLFLVFLGMLVTNVPGAWFLIAVGDGLRNWSP